ncbi:MAG: class III poly(R)-hydroxyalkanoic acid synthase subunit PhaC [Bacteroidota bacterium]
MENPILMLLEKLTQTQDKLTQGFQLFKDIDAIEIGTAEKELVWSLDKTKLYRYKRDSEPSIKTPIVVSYALINRFDMMDLQPDRSLFRKLLSLGMDIYVLDTGYPTRNDRYLRMDDYINGYLDAAIDFVRESHQISKVNLLGVCQGGTFSVIYSAIYPEKIKNLITLVTPIDFSGDDGLLFTWARDMDVDTVVEGFGGLVPGTFLDVGFQMLKPMLKVRKQKNLVDMMDNRDKLMNFMRMEKWINDLPDQAGETYRQFIKDLYQQNKLVKGELIIGDHQIDLQNIDMPVLTIYASEDHLVPPSSTKPLNDLIASKDKKLYEFPGGHIGVFTGRRSQKELSPTIHEFLVKRDQADKVVKKAKSPAKTKTKDASKPSNMELDIKKEEEIPAAQKRNKSSKSEALEKIKALAENFDFTNIGMASLGDKDDLKKITGIGPLIADKLNALGIRTFEQLSKLNPDDILNISKVTEISSGRIQNDKWVTQAKDLLSKLGKPK